MSHESPVDARMRAVALVAQAIDPTNKQPVVPTPSTATVDALIAAVEQDLGAADAAEDRLVKIETQTRALAEAVIAITTPSDAVAPTVQAVKDQM